MASSHSMNRLCFAIFLSGLSGVAFCNDTEVHQQGNSTSVIKQSGSSGGKETKVIKTPQGQKTITRSGNNTDVTIQSNGNSGKRDFGTIAPDAATARPGVESDRFTRGTRDLPDCTTDKSCDRSYEVPTEDEFKDRMTRRMRPL